MRYQVEFRREVVTQDGHATEIEAVDLPTARSQAETMASDMNHDCPDGVVEVGPAEFESWTVASVVEVPDRPSADAMLAANDEAVPGEETSMALSCAAWAGILRAAEAGMPAMGAGDRDAATGVAALRAMVHAGRATATAR